MRPIWKGRVHHPWAHRNPVLPGAGIHRGADDTATGTVLSHVVWCQLGSRTKFKIPSGLLALPRTITLVIAFGSERPQLLPLPHRSRPWEGGRVLPSYSTYGPQRKLATFARIMSSASAPQAQGHPV